MEEKRMKLDLKQFENVNYFNGIDRENLVIQGDMDIYVPHVIRQLWFRSTYPKGQIKTKMLNTMEDLAVHKYCLFAAEVYDNEQTLLAVGHGSANVEEDSFFEAAERRAVSKALANAGFTWHNGNFCNDDDIAKNQMSIYNKYITMGNFDITDQTVKMLYDDALVSVLPEGYGIATGKPIAAMDKLQLANIAQNYGITESGDVLVNAKIRFVYMYQLMENESMKPAEQETIELDQEPKKEPEPKKERKKRRSKNTKNGVLDVAQEATQQEAPQTEKSEEIKEEAPHLSSDTEDVKATETPEEEAKPDVDFTVEEETAAEFFEDRLEQPELSNEPEGDVEFPIGFAEAEDDEMPPFGDEEYAQDNSTVDTVEDENFFDMDIEKEIHKEKVLKEWGYSSEEEICSDWQGHLKNVREKYRELSNSTPEEVQRFIENIPIFDNFLDMEQCDKDTVVLLGDYLNAHKDDVIAALDEGRFPIPTLRKPATWYADFVWDNF